MRPGSVPVQGHSFPVMRIAVDIITGFLGSGKTTLLNRLLVPDAFAETAVLVNELGDIALDHLLVTERTGNIALLEGGCLWTRVVDPAQLGSFSDYSLYEGQPRKGWPVRTILRGRTIMLDHEITGEGGYGRYLSRGQVRFVRSGDRRRRRWRGNPAA